ncbi:MAG: nuclear transport factor 2 family protein [Rhizobiaceae bacterium]|nr:nuclear transport factor 2 family protein [Rhizobiaceae bacterium]
MTSFQETKAVVRAFVRDLDAVADGEIENAIARHTAPDFLWRGMHPFYEQHGAKAVADVFWRPLRKALRPIQRREDIFIAGENDVAKRGGVWTCSMGHMMGLFDEPWLDIPPTGKLAFLRYCEFHCVADGKIVETAFFCDVIGIMQQAGLHPLAPQSGAAILTPGPMTHDGLLYGETNPAEGEKTLELVNRMARELTTSDMGSPQDELLGTWHKDMLWFGPAGIGATYTTERYNAQHQGPFSDHLEDIVFHGHVARIAEGDYAAWFGWPNLTMKSSGGFMGLPASDRTGEMRVVDVYRRAGDKLAENWIFIDIPHFLSCLGLNVLGRARQFPRT